MVNQSLIIVKVKELNLTIYNDTQITYEQLFAQDRDQCFNLTYYHQPLDINRQKAIAIRKDALDFITTLDVIRLVPTVFVVFLFGAWSDSTRRRRPLLWMPAVGNTVYALAIVIDYYDYIPQNAFLYIGALISGLGGGAFTFMMGSSSYNADIVPLARRTHEFALLETMSALSLALSNLLSVYSLSGGDIEGPIWSIFVLSLVAAICCFCIQEPMKDVKHEDYSIPSIWKTYSFLKFSKKACVIFLYLITWGVYVFTLMGQEQTNIAYLRTYPFCFTLEMIAWWVFFEGALMASGTVFMTRIQMSFTSCIKDGGFLHLGVMSRMIASFILILVSGDIGIFIGRLHRA